MKFKIGDKVITQHMDGKYNNAAGIITKVFTDMDVEMVYMVVYNVPFGSITKGMFKESDLKKKARNPTGFRGGMDSV